MISTRASKLSALAISTICWSAIERPRTGRSGSSRTPRRSSSSWTLRCIAPPVDPPQRAERVVAHDDVLRDAEVGEQRRLLVDHRDAGVARVVRGVEVDRLAVDEHRRPRRGGRRRRAPSRASTCRRRSRPSARAPRRGAARGCRRAARGRRRRTSLASRSSTIGAASLTSPRAAWLRFVVDPHGLSSVPTENNQNRTRSLCCQGDRGT